MAQKPALVAVWSLLPILLALSYWGAPVQPGEAADLTGPAQYRQVLAGAALELRLRSDDGAEYPPGELVLSDPTALTTGDDPRLRSRYREIPGATYTSEAISPSQEGLLLVVPNAVSGTYSLRVIGVDYGKYYLSMRGFDASGTHADISFTALLEPGQVHHYLIKYSNRGGASIRARRTPAID